jgi:hypothetical protein
MAMALDVTGARRTDKGWFIPLSELIVNYEDNSRFAKPQREQIDLIKDSIKRREEEFGVGNGQITPGEFAVMPNKKPRLNAGFTRFAALLELQEEDGKPREMWLVPFKGNEEEAYLRSIEENSKRNPPTPMDNAKNIRKLVEGFKWDMAKVAKFYGKSPAWVSETLKLVALSTDEQAKVHNGEIGRDGGIFLAAKVMPEMRQQVLDEALQIAAERIGAMAPVEPDPVDPPVSDDPTPDSVDAPPSPENTPVAPTPKGKGKGKKTAPAPAPAVPPASAGKGKATSKTRKVGKVTTGDIEEAARRQGAVAPDSVPTRNMSQLKKYLRETVETELKESPIGLLCADLLSFCDGKLSETQIGNRLNKYCKAKV